MLLKALSMGQINDDKTTLIPVLDTVIIDYPGTPEAAKAQEMITVIKDGYSKNIEADFGSKFPFEYNDRAAQWVIIFLPESENSSAAKIKMVDFHREFFSRDKLKVNSKIYGDQSVILINDFATEADGSEYIRVFKSTRKYLLDLQNAKILMITQDNLRILYEKQNLAEYEKFYEEFY